MEIIVKRSNEGVCVLAELHFTEPLRCHIVGGGSTYGDRWADGLRSSEEGI